MLRRTLLPLMLFLAFGVSATIAQETEAPKKAGETAKPPPPEDIVLQTADGVKLAATFYPSTKKKKAVTVILLHMKKRSRNDYAGVAANLHKLGHAVLVPDLRGHGDSTTVKNMRAPLNAANMPPMQFAAMVRYDMPVLKQFLVQRNNAGELNIEKLCLVGAEMGASVALNYAYFDWSLPPQGNKKQGQDVKALVLISPEWTTKGLAIGTTMAGRPMIGMAFDPQLQAAFKDAEAMNFQGPVAFDFRREVSVYVVCGKGTPKAVSDSQRLHKMLKSHHPDPPAGQGTEQRDLFFGTLETTLQGTKMLGVRGLNLEQRIAWFIEMRLVKRSVPWAERTDPYQ